MKITVFDSHQIKPRLLHHPPLLRSYTNHLCNLKPIAILATNANGVFKIQSSHLPLHLLESFVHVTPVISLEMR